MCNTVLTYSIFPDAWKMSKILPVPKIPNPGELRDYRPIRVPPTLSKALEFVMRNQMIQFIDENWLLSPCQYGFRSGHSMATALLKITNDIQRDCDRRLVTFLLLLDFSKVFANVRHSLLLKNL
jgi:retron-type reverse transcriptase